MAISIKGPIVAAAVVIGLFAAKLSYADKFPAELFSISEAAELAAKLANDECYKRFERRPFLAKQYPITFFEDRFRWGRMDPGAEGGISAEVSFGPRGEDPKVQIYLSDDKNIPFNDF
jgi:hypothetical protein